MKNLLLIALILSCPLITFSVDEESDEFEITEPAFEINASKENINPDKKNEEEIPEIIPPEEIGSQEKAEELDLGIPQEPVSNEETVLVRTREEPEVIPASPPGEYVEVRAPNDVYAAYKKRQNDWGFLVSFGSEQIFFPKLLTQVGLSNGDDYTFDEMFGHKVNTMYGIELGPKYNTSFGSLALLGGYASINRRDSRVSAPGADSISEYTFSRSSLTALFYLDALFKEPYFVPYVGGGIWQADYRETSTSYPDEVGKYTTEPGMLYKFGALIGLDWLEEDAARISRKRNGTKATFLNVYAVTTTMTESDPDPDLSTEMDIGASIIIEF